MKLKLTGPFHLETQVKAQIARNYLRDASEWLFIHKKIQEIDEYIAMSFEAKKFINLRFSMECSLKSLIMSLSKRKERAEEAYNIARKFSHNLMKLFEECKKRAEGKYKICSKSFIPEIDKIEKLGIEIRYDLDFKIAYKKQSFRELFVNGPISSVILDSSFHEKFWHETINLYKKTNKIYGIRFKKHRLILFSNSGKIDEYIRTKIMKNGGSS